MSARFWLLAALLVLLGYGAFCAYHATIVAGGSDSSGYFNLARALVSGHIEVPSRAIEGVPATSAASYTYTPLGFRPNGAGATMTPTYPVGLPVLLALCSEPINWTVGPQLLFAFFSIAGVALTYGLARQAGASCPAATLGAVALALCPVYLRYCFYAMSDLPALVACAAVIWCAARTSLRSAIAAGALMGMAVLIRPTNVLLLPSLLLAVGPNWRRHFGIIAGGIPFAISFLLFNHAAYGSPFATGYIEVASKFSTEWVLTSLLHYARWTPLLLSPLVVLALVTPFATVRSRRSTWAHAIWVVALFGFYALYFHTHESWWYLRFVLPAFPSLIVLALTAGEALLARLDSPRARLALGLGAAVIVIASNGYSLRALQIVAAAGDDLIYPRAVQLARSQLPPNAVIFAMQYSGTLYYGSNFVIVRWDMAGPQWPRLRTAAEKAGRPIYALLFNFEMDDALHTQVPGNWRTLHDESDLHLLRLEPSASP